MKLRLPCIACHMSVTKATANQRDSAQGRISLRAVYSGIALLYYPLTTAPCTCVHSVVFLHSRSQVTVPCL